MAPSKQHPQWKRMGFKKNKVWVAVDEAGRTILENGKALIKYQLKQDYEYWVNQKNLYELTENNKNQPHSTKTSQTARKAPTESASFAEADADAIRIFTDGACSGNPGPAGIGVVLSYRGKRKEISRFIGSATNNIAELEAIRTALLAVKQREKPILLYTDSSYAVGVLTKGWKAKQNVALVEEIRNLLASFPKINVVKVKGHAGNPDNERADFLAVKAIS